MRRLVLAAALLAIPTPSYALGIGTTFYTGTDGISDAGMQTIATPAYPGTYPSVDIAINDRVYLQLHLLELLQGIAETRAIIGLNGYFGVSTFAVTGPLTGQLAIGGSFDMVTTRADYEDPAVVMEVLGRLGFTFGQELKFGVFVVPGIGFAVVPESAVGNSNTDLELAFSGKLQFSAWIP